MGPKPENGWMKTGYSQVKGIDYLEIFSPVIWYESICLMFALAALKNWYITGLDVKTAFLYGKLNEEIYMKQLLSK